MPINYKPIDYKWARLNESEEWVEINPKDKSAKKIITIIATSGGYEPEAETNLWITKRTKCLQDLGFEVYVPKFSNGSLVFEPNIGSSSSIRLGGGNSRDRGLSAESGVSQIIDCVHNSWDIFPFMGGMGMVDKIGAVVEHFKTDHFRPENPIRIFNFSDCSYYAFLQSHHPDIFRFYSTFSSRDFYLPQVPEGFTDKEEYAKILARNRDALANLLQADQLESYSRPTLYLPDSKEIIARNIQYFPLHSDMIWADAIDFDIERGGGALASDGKTSGKGHLRFGHMLSPACHLNTAQPYILGFESFLQQSSIHNKYDNDFPRYLDEFLAKRAAVHQLPLAIEMGLFETRLDGDNGYASYALRLHDEATGLIKIDEFNIERIFKYRAQIAIQFQAIIDAKPEENPSEHLTEIPPQVREKLLASQELDYSDIKAILVLENEKIIERQQQVKAICQRYNIPLIINNRHGHSLNNGVTGGGIIDVKISEKEAILDHVPSAVRYTPLSTSANPTFSTLAGKEAAAQVDLP